MKFVTVSIRCHVQAHDPDAHDAEQPQGEMGHLELKLTASDNETTKETLERLGRIIEEKANLVDIGDCD